MPKFNNLFKIYLHLKNAGFTTEQAEALAELFIELHHVAQKD